MGTQSTLFGPLKYGILPQHLEESELIGGNGMIQMATYIAILLGTIIGGILIALKPHGAYLVSITVVCIACCGWIASRFIPVAQAADSTLRINWNFASETLHIIGFARENRTVFWSIIAISWFWFYGATFLAMIPSYTRDILSGNEHVTTLLLAAFSIGIGTGSLLCEKLSRKKIEIGLVPLGAIGLSLFAMDLYFIGAPSPDITEQGLLIKAAEFMQHFQYWRVLLDLTCIGLFGGLYIVPLYALIQNRSHVSRRSRIIAANNILNALFMVVSAIMTILLLTMLVTIPSVFLIVAILNIVVTIMVFIQIPDFFQSFIRWIKE